MRVMVFFDLPTLTLQDKRAYTKFRKHLIKSGFIMMQESVYSKIALNTTAAHAVIENVKKETPENGLVQLLTITEKQYSKIDFLLGQYQGEVLDTDERLVIL